AMGDDVAEPDGEVEDANERRRYGQGSSVVRGACGSGSWRSRLERGNRGRRSAQFQPRAADTQVELDDVGAGDDAQDGRQVGLAEAGVGEQRVGVGSHTRSMYELSRVSTRTLSPVLTNNGTLMVRPVSNWAGFVPPVAVSPLKPGSVCVTSSTTFSGK